ncbi:hypothetical protein LINPERHAP2_LOCUS39697 [Linum perenne]
MRKLSSMHCRATRKIGLSLEKL